MAYRDRVDLESIQKEAALFETLWEDLVNERGEYRYIEMLDRHRRCYGRVLLPSEVMFVWNKTGWISATDSDQYGAWEPVVSMVEKG
jgi:hypothetical protein